MKFIKDSLLGGIQDFIKENIKTVIIFIFTTSGIGAIVALLRDKIFTTNIHINLGIIIAVAVVYIISIIFICLLITKNRKFVKEIYNLKNPENDNVKNFKVGNIVLLKIQKDYPVPPKLSVCKIHTNEIECRDSSGKTLKYSPEELLTEFESKTIFDRIDAERICRERENANFWSTINR